MKRSDFRFLDRLRVQGHGCAVHKITPGFKKIAANAVAGRS